MKYSVATYINKFLVFFIFPISIATVGLLSLPRKLLAQFEGNSGNTDVTSGSNGSNNFSYQLKNPLEGVNDIGSFIKKLLDIVLTIGIPIVALFIIYSGFLFVVARGNEEKLTQAKQTLMYTLLGAAILLGSWVLAKALGSTIEQLQ